MCPVFFEVKLTVFAALLALAGPALSQGCEENGARYEGEFKNGKVDGKGAYTSPKGVRYEGGFIGGKLKELKPSDCPSTPGPLNC